MASEKTQSFTRKSLKVVTWVSVFFVLLDIAITILYGLLNPMDPGLAIIVVRFGFLWSLFSVPFCLGLFYPALKHKLIKRWCACLLASGLCFFIYWTMAMMY